MRPEVKGASLSDLHPGARSWRAASLPVYLMTMSSLAVRVCCAMILLAASACGPRVATSPSHPSAEARNGETEKKTRKQRPPLVAPPPAYGNKIVRDIDSEDVDVAGLDQGRRQL